MKKAATISPEFTLEQTKESCEQVQRGGWQLEIISFSSIEENGKTIAKNKAVFRREFSDKILNELTFTVIGKTAGKNDAASIAKMMKDEGRTPICETEIYVEKNLTKVYVSGKIS